MLRKLFGFIVGACIYIGTTNAAPLVTFDNYAAFVTATGALNATGPLPNLGYVIGGTATVGSVTFRRVAPLNTFYIGGAGHTVSDWTLLLAGNDIAINDYESIDISLAGSVFAFGFEYVQPQTTYCGYVTCTNSTFQVVLKDGLTPVNSFFFDGASDVASFIGVWSDTAFDGVEIREITGSIADQYFGQFYTGSSPLVAEEPATLFVARTRLFTEDVVEFVATVPEPTSLALLGAALGAFGLSRRRKKT